MPPKSFFLFLNLTHINENLLKLQYFSNPLKLLKFGDKKREEDIQCWSERLWSGFRIHRLIELLRLKYYCLD